MVQSALQKLNDVVIRVLGAVGLAMLLVSIVISVSFRLIDRLRRSIAFTSSPERSGQFLRGSASGN